MSAHDYVDFDPGKGAVIQVVAHQCTGYKFSGRTEAGTVIGHQQVVIHGLWHVERPELEAFSFRHVVDDVAGVGRVVAADIVKIADIAFLEDCKDAGAILVVRFIPAGTQRRRRRPGDPLKCVDGEFLQIDEIFLDDARDGMQTPVEAVDLLVFAHFFNYADQGRVDNARGPARLADNRISHSKTLPDNLQYS